MISILLPEGRPDYEYDARGLIGSFYPGEELVLGAAADAQPISVPDFPEIEDKGLRKNEVKRSLYRQLAQAAGRQLPWGTLTGIRPTKLVTGLLEQGASEEEIARYMRETYLISDEKLALSLDIAKEEQRVLEGIHYHSGYSLYIGIPFCPTRCLYCSFTAYPIGVWKKRVGEYLETLAYEMQETVKLFPGKTLDTVYIGGGTPTSLEPEQLDYLLTKVEKHFDLSHIREFTVEAGRPDSITRAKLEVMRKHRISRISVNPQSMNQKTLDTIGRLHTVEAVEDTFRLARELGFDNINMDIILGLPGEGPEEVKETVRRISALRPDSLTVHALAVKRASRLKTESAGPVKPGFTQEEAETMMAIAREGAQAMGLVPYYLYRQKNMAGNLENVGFAAPGKAGIYNILIMEEKQSILALGAGTVSKAVWPDGLIERADNVKEVPDYIGRIDEMIERKKKLWH